MDSNDIPYVGTSVRGITKEITIPVPWGNVSGKVYGDCKGSPVLCLHGWLDNCNTFDALIPFLPKNRFYVFVDYAGQGKSSPFSKGFIYSNYMAAAFIERIRKYFQWSYFSILGHSMGGNQGVFYATIFPEKVDKIILLDVVGIIIHHDEMTERQLRTTIEYFAKYEKLVNEPPRSYSYKVVKQKLLKANKSLNDQAADILLERGTLRQPDGKYIFTRDMRHLIGSTNNLPFNSLILVLTKVKAEMIHILAENGLFAAADHVIKEGFEQAFREGFQNCEYHMRVEVPGQHFVHLCDPERVSYYVSSFLNRPIRAGIRLPSKL